MNLLRKVVWLFASAVAGTWLLAAGVRADTIAIPYRSASEFVESVGVNVHLHFAKTPYQRFEDLVVPVLRELGVLHVRDEAINDDPKSKTIPVYYSRLRTLADAGVRSTLIVFDNTRPTALTDLSGLEKIYELTGRSVEAFEGSNEPDLAGAKNWASINELANGALYGCRGFESSRSQSA